MTLSGAPSVLRPAKRDDIPGLARLWARAFPGERTAAERGEELREGMTWGGLDDCWIADGEGGVIEGALRTYRMTVHVQGRAWPTMGLAGVAVTPGARRKGLARRMCIQALHLARERGDVLSALYPFRASFYADLGYTLAGTLHRYRFPPAALPVFDGWRGVRYAEVEDEVEIRGVYQRVARRSTGMVDRTEGAWRFLAAQDVVCVLHGGEEGRADGYLVARPRRTGPDAVLQVRELMAESKHAYRALLGWLAAQRDQWVEVIYDALPGEKLHHLLSHPRTPRSGKPRGLWFQSARILRGPMFRLLDVSAVQEGQGGSVADPLLDSGRSGDADSTAGSAGTVDIRRATRLFLNAALPGQLPPPDGWSPALGLTDVRLLDEF